MTRKIKDLTDQKFGSLTAKEYAGKVEAYPSWWCECTCGKRTVVPAYKLYRGYTVNCPFCQTGKIVAPITYKDQRIAVLRQERYLGMGESYLYCVVKTLEQGGKYNALLVMLEPTPSESLQDLGTELEDPADSVDNADSAEEIWQNNPIHFSKSVDK